MLNLLIQSKLIEFKGDQKMSLAVQFAGKCVKLELVACNPDTAAGFTQKLTKAITANNNTKKLYILLRIQNQFTVAISNHMNECT